MSVLLLIFAVPFLMLILFIAIAHDKRAHCRRIQEGRRDGRWPGAGSEVAWMGPYDGADHHVGGHHDAGHHGGGDGHSGADSTSGGDGGGGGGGDGGGGGGD